jgi:hypothetical protein
MLTTAVVVYASLWAMTSIKSGALFGEYVISMAHSVVSVTSIIAFALTGALHKMTWNEWFGDYESAWIDATLTQSLAYFIVDTGLMVVSPQVPLLLTMVAHHIGMFTLLGTALLTRTASPVLFTFLIEEFSTILLNARWFSGKQKSWTAAFAGTFFIVRIIGGSILATQVIVGSMQLTYVSPYLVAMILTMLASRILNLYWFATICRLCFCDPRAAKHPR